MGHPAVQRVVDWLGYVCAGLFVLMVCTGVTIGIINYEPGPDSGPSVDRNGVPPAFEFGDGYGYQYEREWPR